MPRETLYDRHKLVIGYPELVDGKRIELRDRHLKLLGYYVPATNETFDAYGLPPPRFKDEPGCSEAATPSYGLRAIR